MSSGKYVGRSHTAVDCVYYSVVRWVLLGLPTWSDSLERRRLVAAPMLAGRARCSNAAIILFFRQLADKTNTFTATSLTDDHTPPTYT